MKKLVTIIIGLMLCCATQVRAQNMVAYSAYKFFGINAEDTTSFPTFLILPGEYARSRELLELEHRTAPNIIENPSIYNAGTKRMEENLKKAKASGEMDPETIKMMEEEIAEIRSMGAEAAGNSISQEELKSMREEVFSHALFKKYFWNAETMYGNIIAIQDRKMPEVYNNTHKVWGIMNDKGEMVIPCNRYISTTTRISVLMARSSSVGATTTTRNTSLARTVAR